MTSDTVKHENRNDSLRRRGKPVPHTREAFEFFGGFLQVNAFVVVLKVYRNDVISAAYR